MKYWNRFCLHLFFITICLPFLPTAGKISSRETPASSVQLVHLLKPLTDQQYVSDSIDPPSIKENEHDFERESLLNSTTRTANFIPDTLHSFTKTFELVSGKAFRSKRDTSGFDLTSTFRSLRSKTDLNEGDLGTLKKMEEYYKKILSGKLDEKPNLEDIEKDKNNLVRIFKEVVNERVEDKELKMNIENILRNVTENMNPSLLKSLQNNSSIGLNIHLNDEILRSQNLEGTETKKEETTVLYPNTEQYRNPNGTKSKHSHNPNAHTHKTSSRYVTEKFADSEMPSLISILDEIEFQGHDVKPASVQDINKNYSNSALFSRIGQVDSFAKETSSFQLDQLKSQSTLKLLPSPTRNQIYTQQMHPLFYDQLYHSDSSPMSSSGYREVVTSSPPNTGDSGLQENSLNALLGFISNEDVLTTLEEYILSSQTGSASTSLGDTSWNPDFSGLQKAIAAPYQPTNSPGILFVDNINLKETQPSANIPLASLATNNFFNTNEALTVPPEVLANLMVRLQVPTAAELANAIPDTRLTPELTGAFAALIMALSDALTTFLTDLQAALADNPLLAAILALGLVALIWHLLKKKKKGGYGHNHGHGGYHRKTWEPEFRHFNDYGQELTYNVLTQLATFEQWLKTIDNLKHSSSYEEIT